MEAKFSLGQLVATPGALATFTPEEQALCLSRHKSCDWGDLDSEDLKANDAALSNGERILSSYKLGESRKLWIITEAADDEGREATTLLLPEDY